MKKIFSEVGSKKHSEINLGDSIRFDLNAKPGYIEIKFLKNRNSEISFHRLEDLCAGIKDVLQR